MTAAGTVDLAIEGPRGRAVRVPRDTYWVGSPEVTDVWVVDSDTLLQPFRQFVISATNHGHVGYLFKIAAVDPTGEPARPADGAIGVGFDPPIATRTFTGDDQTARDLCRMIAGNLVDGRLPMGAAPRVWDLVVAASVHMIEQARREADHGPVTVADGPDPGRDPFEVQGDDNAVYRRGFAEGERQGREWGRRIAATQADGGVTAYEQGRATGIRAAAHWVHMFIRADVEGFDRDTLSNIHKGLSAMAASARERNAIPDDANESRLMGEQWWEGYTAGCAMSHAVGCDAVEAERDEIRGQIHAVSAVRDDALRKLYDVYDALNEADPVKYPEPADAAQRIRALGDRARQITDIHAGALERLAEPAKPTAPEALFMFAIRGRGGRLGVVHDILTERQRAEAKFPDQHLPDGTGEHFRYSADMARDECDRALQMGIATWQQVTAEEVFEAFAETDPVKLRAEVVQTAAMCVRWAEDIDRRAGGQADAE